MRSFSVCFTALMLSLAACSNTVEEPKTDNSNKPSAPTPLPPGPDKLIVTDEAVGTGDEVKNGDSVKVHYTGTLMNGKEFDSSRGKGKPFEFKVGTGGVIKGWDQGVLGMKVGGKRKLVIPSELGYGASGHPPTIPADAGLKFDVELIEIVGPADAGAKPKDAGK
jgi:FKBP-type peptidyl-prolyl cis-trans isomerase